MASPRSALCAAACLVVVSTAACQGDYDLDKATPGTLGGPLQLEVRNAPANAFMLLMPSFNAGPTPIALIDPTDPRSLQVGTDLLGIWALFLTSPAGTVTAVANLPLDPSFQGIVLHWQSLTLPGPVHFIDRISNDVVVQVGLPNTAQLVAAALASGRAFGARVALPQTNAGGGDVMITGGGNGTLFTALGSASTEIWDFRHLQIQPGPTMTTPRALHVAVPLAAGRTLLIGGVGATGGVLTSCEVYDPLTGSFAATGPMATPRVLHTAVRLADGRVMVAGGTTVLTAGPTAVIASAMSSVEIWDPSTGTWSAAAPIGGLRLAPALTLLPAGNVMLSGGVEVTLVLGVPTAAISTTAVQLFDPATGSWSAGAPMPSGRAGHHHNQVRLPSNRVLMTGGLLVPNLLGLVSAGPIAGADVYDPATNTWTSSTMNHARWLHSASLLPGGGVAVGGGAQATLALPLPIASVELYDPATNAWTLLPPLTSPRLGHVATVQPDGLLILFGGLGITAALNSIESLHF